MAPPLLRLDHAGDPIRVPPRSTLEYVQFADLVDALTPDHCAFPDGRRTDPKTKQPCRRHKLCDDGCELHASRKAARSMRLARHMPKSLKLRFANAATDPQLLNIGHDVAIVDARRQELLGRLGTGESGDAWRLLQEVWTDFVSEQQQAKTCKDTGDDVGFAKHSESAMRLMQTLGKTIKSGNEDENTWAEVLKIEAMLASYKTAETRRLRESGQVLSAEEALMLVQRMIDAVNDIVRDDSQKRELAVTLARLVGIAGVRSTRPEPDVVDAGAAIVGLSVEDYLK